MALEPEFLQMTTQTISVNALSTHDAYGQAVYSTAASAPRCYIEPGSRVVINGQGVEEVASGMIYVLSTSVTVGAQDLVTLPSGVVPKIIRADQVNDEEGLHHTELAFS